MTTSDTRDVEATVAEVRLPLVISPRGRSAVFLAGLEKRLAAFPRNPDRFGRHFANRSPRPSASHAKSPGGFFDR